MPATDPTTSGSPAQQQPSPAAAPRISSVQICESYACGIWATRRR